MGRKRLHRHQRGECNSLLTNEFKHDLERLRKILGPCKDIDELEEVLTWPQKAQAEKDAEWLLLCNEYAKLTGSTQPMDGIEIPSMADLCYYIGDWALKYAEMGTTIPTASGKTPSLPPYWSKNQVLLYADNGRVCPSEFKQEMDDEVFYLLHSINIDSSINGGNSGSSEGSDESDQEILYPEIIRKLEAVMKYFFFAGDDLAQTFEYVCEEYEKRLRRGLLQVQTTPFSDLLYKITDSGLKQVTQSQQIELVKSFVVECELLKSRDFQWGLKNATFDLRLPSCLPPPIPASHSSDYSILSIPHTITSVAPHVKWQKLKGMVVIFSTACFLVLFITVMLNYR